tara:strand:+ start:2091 stop:2366 length:276 start_codon:yes stop_codon:yes gene_type:complete
MEKEMEYEWEEFLFVVNYIYEKSTFAGDYMQPPDPDNIEIISVNLISYTSEDGEEIKCSHDLYVQHILSGQIFDSINEAVWEDVENNEYHL